VAAALARPECGRVTCGTSGHLQPIHGIPARVGRFFRAPPAVTGASSSGGVMGMALREKAEIVDADGLKRIVTRIAHEIVERNKGVEDLVLVGIKRRGVPLAQRIAERIQEFEGRSPVQGSLDITLYRDDLSMVAQQPVVGGSEIPVDVRGKVVVL